MFKGYGEHDFKPWARRPRNASGNVVCSDCSLHNQDGTSCLTDYCQHCVLIITVMEVQALSGTMRRQLKEAQGVLEPEHVLSKIMCPNFGFMFGARVKTWCRRLQRKYVWKHQLLLV